MNFSKCTPSWRNRIVKTYEQAATIVELKTEIASLAATVKDQTAQIQKVAAEVKTSKAAPQLVMTKW